MSVINGGQVDNACPTQLFGRVCASLLHYVYTCYFHRFVLEKSMLKFGGKFPTKLAPTGWPTQGNMHYGGNPQP